MVLYCLLQIIGLKTINQGGVRVDGTLGNAIYLAVYMLFHIFVATLFLWREWKSTILRWTYGLLILLQVFVLYHTATRGAILGLLGGLFVMAVLNIRNREDKVMRRGSLGIISGLTVLAIGFWLLRDTSLVKNSPVLTRFASISTEELKTGGRAFVWPIALEGIKEKPFLGWGQENFNYVFQKHYSPEMYNLEPWFDRAHNIFLDWAIAGGLIGLLSYLALYLALLLSIWKSSENWSYAEKSILTGLVAAYFFHNFFVFDHLISYILFFSLLAYAHSKSDGKVFFGEKVFEEFKIKAIALPAASILLLVSLYFTNIKPIIANVFLIEAFKSVQTPGEMVQVTEKFSKAYNASRLGRSEVVEHTASNSFTILTSDISMEDKNAFFAFAKEAVLEETEDLKDEARYQLMSGSFLSTVGLLDEALVRLERARELMPDKQQIYFEIGAVYINKDDRKKALEVFKQAYELAPGYIEAKLVYLIGAIYADDRVLEAKLISELPENIVTKDNRIISAYKAVGR